MWTFIFRPRLRLLRDAHVDAVAVHHLLQGRLLRFLRRGGDVFFVAENDGAIRAARRGDIKRHRQTMVALFWMALILTGFFTFWPGRVMYQVVTGA